VRRLLAVGIVLGATVLAVEIAQPSGSVDFRGFTLGETTRQDVIAKLGQPRWGNPNADEKVVYDSSRQGHTDALMFERVALEAVEAATPPAGLETCDTVVARLGQPEYRLQLPAQFMYEYCRHGARFWFKRETGETIGVVHFPAGDPRVPAGEPNVVDLSKMRKLGGGTPILFQAGAASETISPPDLSNIGTRWNIVHDDLLARCLVLSKNEKTIAILGADLFAFTAHEIDPIRKAAEQAGIDYLLFASSHTHSAPDTVGVYGYYPEKYVELIQKKCIECVRTAARNLAPATIQVGQRELPLDGGRIEQISYNARNPGIVDPFLTVARVVAQESGDAPGKTLCTLVNFACHPERLAGYQGAISSDYVGALRQEVEKQVGGTCIFVNGALGGMLTPDGISGADRFEDTQRIGTWLGQRVGEMLHNGMTNVTEPTFEVAVRPLEIPVISPKLLLPMKQGTLKGKLMQGRHPTEVARVDIGEMQIIAVPGELLPELGFAVRERMTGAVNVIVGLANDEIGYIVPAYDFRAGTYEESMSLGPSAGPQIVGAAFDLLKTK